jgi:GNAT superfamily N-acetyltransferase
MNIQKMSIKKFNDYLNENSTYGFIDTEKNYNDTDYGTKYKTSSPTRFFNTLTGICWDYASAEYYYFKKYYPEIKCKLFYIQVDNEDQTTHTWLQYYQNNKCYIFESSWYDYQGITMFNNEYEALNYYINLFLKYTNSKGYNLFEYNINKYNLTTSEFINYIWDYGNLYSRKGNFGSSIFKNHNVHFYNGTYLDCQSIVNTLSKKELIYIDGKYIDSPYLYYRNVIFYRKKPISFIEIYNIPTQSNKGIIKIVTSKSYRQRGYASQLIEEVINYFSEFDENIKTLVWRCNKSNVSVNHLANKYKFNLISENDYQYTYELNL